MVLSSILGLLWGQHKPLGVIYLEEVQSVDELPDINLLKEGRKKERKKKKEREKARKQEREERRMEENRGGREKTKTTAQLEKVLRPWTLFLETVVDPFYPDHHKMKIASSVLGSLGTAGRRVFENAFLAPFQVVSEAEYGLSNYRTPWRNHGREPLGLPSDVPALHLLLLSWRVCTLLDLEAARGREPCFGQQNVSRWDSVTFRA